MGQGNGAAAGRPSAAAANPLDAVVTDAAVVEALIHRQKAYAAYLEQKALVAELVEAMEEATPGMAHAPLPPPLARPLPHVAPSNDNASFPVLSDGLRWLLHTVDSVHASIWRLRGDQRRRVHCIGARHGQPKRCHPPGPPPPASTGWRLGHGH
jgi:hypothetical protein